MFLVNKFGSFAVQAFKILNNSGVWTVKNYSKSNSDVIRSIHPQVQELINKQINLELSALYSYMALEVYYENDMLPGFAKHQIRQQKEELDHARVLLELMKLRQCQVQLFRIDPPQPQQWSSPLEAVRTALQLESTTAMGLKQLINVAEKLEDHHVADTVQHCLYNQQMKCLRDANTLLQQLSNCSSPECLLLIDRSLRK